jgi:hypothetical protein
MIQSKNIFLIPTDKPSRLGQSVFDNSFHYNPNFYELEEKRVIPQNIYITSNEEIKESDWFICGNEILKCTETYSLTSTSYVKCKKGDCSSEICKKIILTTDPSLDDIQPIPDEFLEWFVKNPSCESVELEKWTDYKFENDKEVVFFNHKIIIPKEEPKQREMFLMNATTVIDTRKPKQEPLEEHYLSIPKPLVDVSRMKVDNHPDIDNKKTLEEATRKYLKNCKEAIHDNIMFIQGSNFGAKWQQEQDKKLYSEEDMKQFGLYLGDNLKKLKGKSIDEIFEQFKKK